MDPLKLSATIEVVDKRARVLAVGRQATDKIKEALVCRA
jgi:sorbitol-specific phosphotransferase system component IIA